MNVNSRMLSLDFRTPTELVHLSDGSAMTAKSHR